MRPLRALMGVASFNHMVDRALLSVEPCATLRRLGSTHDGGYVVDIESLTQATHLLSFGVATNWDFERAVVALKPSITIDAFDPSVYARRFVEWGLRSAINAPLRLISGNLRGARASVRRIRAAVDYFQFFSGAVRHHAARVWYNDDRGSASIDRIIDRARVHGRHAVFAKIDIEGSEYRILPAIIANAELFTGLTVEFHHTDICAQLFNEQMALLRREFRVVHVHGNNYGDLSIDHALPLSLEISFARRRAVDHEATDERGPTSVPGPLDAPNDPRRADYSFVLD